MSRPTRPAMDPSLHCSFSRKSQACFLPDSCLHSLFFPTEKKGFQWSSLSAHLFWFLFRYFAVVVLCCCCCCPCLCVLLSQYKSKTEKQQVCLRSHVFSILLQPQLAILALEASSSSNIRDRVTKKYQLFRLAVEKLSRRRQSLEFSINRNRTGTAPRLTQDLTFLIASSAVITEGGISSELGPWS